MLQQLHMGVKTDSKVLFCVTKGAAHEDELAPNEIKVKRD